MSNGVKEDVRTEDDTELSRQIDDGAFGIPA